MKRKLLLAIMLIPALLVTPAILDLDLADGTPGVVPKKATWIANTETDKAGYYVYWGASEQAYNNDDRIDVGDVTEYDLAAVPGPKIAITCYDTSNNESGYSNSVNLDNTAPSSNSTLSVEEIVPPSP